MSSTGLGILEVQPPLIGQWPWSSFPQIISFAGNLYQLARWAWPYEGVSAQYRQVVARNALHMLVYKTGQYIVSHADEYNPDMGFVAEHAAADIPLVKCVLFGALGFLTGMTTGLLVFRSSETE
jgi:hypothetical protein